MEVYARCSSPLGDILLRADGQTLTGLWFEGQGHAPAAPGEIVPASSSAALSQAVRWLETYFSGHEPGFAPPIRTEGTPFRRAVWEILRTIPYGQTMTYGDIAARIARERGLPRMSAQAVGGAVGHNPISLIVPCHRVVGSDGDLTGYGGGLDRKVSLLRLEGADTSCFHLPRRKKLR